MQCKPNTHWQRTDITWECRQGKRSHVLLGFCMDDHSSITKNRPLHIRTMVGVMIGELRGENEKGNNSEVYYHSSQPKSSQPEIPIFPSKSLLPWPCSIPRVAVWSYHHLTSESPYKSRTRLQIGCITWSGSKFLEVWKLWATVTL